MSIYPVRLAEWFPLGDERYWICIGIVSSSRCPSCRSKIRYSKAVGHHSVPFGYGEVFCGWKCCNSGKVAKPDKRRQRRLRRRHPEIYNWMKSYCEDEKLRN